MRASLLFCTLIILAIFSSCDKPEEDYSSEAVSDYLPLQVGKYWTYRTDSTVFANFGRTPETHSYQERHYVEAAITDALGKPAFRIQRSLRNLAGTDGWRAAGSFVISTNSNAERSENNLRFINLVQPIKKDMQWKGNSFLPTDPYAPLYNFSNDDYMADWIYEYKSSGETTTINGKTYTDVITIQQVADSLNVPVVSPQIPAFKNLGMEKYSKGVGMIYQELVMWEYQPNTSGGSPYYIGFGVKRSLIDHN
jgi:hypothetical protein